MHRYKYHLSFANDSDLQLVIYLPLKDCMYFVCIYIAIVS